MCSPCIFHLSWQSQEEVFPWSVWVSCRQPQAFLRRYHRAHIDHGKMSRWDLWLEKSIPCTRYVCSKFLRSVQTERVIRSRIGQFNACIKHAQIENSISYCVNACNLCRSELTFNQMWILNVLWAFMQCLRKKTAERFKIKEWMSFRT